MTLQQAFRKWMASTELAGNTITSYRAGFESLPLWIRTSDVQDITRESITASLTGISNAFHAQPAIMGALKYARVTGHLEKAPEDWYTSNRSRNRRNTPKFLTRSQLAHFLDCAQNEKFYAVYFLAVTTGLRRGEVFGLRWSDILDGIITVERQVQRVEGTGGLGLVRVKTDSSNRRVPISPKTLELLRNHKNPGYTEKPQDGLIFVNRKGGLINPNNFCKYHLKKVAKRAGLEVNFHMFRHTFATMAMESGISHFEIQRILGHARINTTLDVYSHMTEQALSVVANKVNELFGQNLKAA